jgi:hypothetical protein
VTPLTLEDRPATAAPVLAMIAVTAIVVIASTIYRNPVLFFDPQMVSEDLFVYFNEDRLFGARALIEPYSGYLQLCCRLIAYFAGQFPARYTAAIYSGLFVAAIFATSAIIFTSPIFTGWGKVLAAAALTCSPTNSEVFFGMLYTQWIMTPLTALAMIEQPTTRGRMALMVGCFTMVGLSSPFVVLAIPFVAWKAWSERSRYAYSLCAAALAALMVQLPGILSRSTANHTGGTSLERAFQSSSLLYSWLTGPNYPGARIALAVGVPVLIFTAWYLWQNRASITRPLLYFVVYGVLTVVPGCLWVPAELHANQFFFGARYFYPAVVLIVMTFVLVEQESGRRATTFPMIAVLLCAIYAAHVTPISGHITNRNWKETAACVETAADCRALLNPGNTGGVKVPSEREAKMMTPEDRRAFPRTQRF